MDKSIESNNSMLSPNFEIPCEVAEEEVEEEIPDEISRLYEERIIHQTFPSNTRVPTRGIVQRQEDSVIPQILT